MFGKYLFGKYRFWLMIAVLLTAASGANCPQVLQQYTQPIPRALSPTPTLEQVINVVNSNSSQVVALYSNRATTSLAGFPSLRTNIAFQRGRNFRLRADTALTGPEVDLGSNDQLFWFWVKRNQPPALYFCRHEQFGVSAARRIIPVDPQWLVEALGVVSFEPGGQHAGPYPVHGGRLEIRTQPTMPGGPTRLVVVDDSRGLVLENHLYDSQGQRLASAVMTRHQRDPLTGVTLPRHVDVQLPPAQLDLALDLKELQINTLSGPQELWTKPTYPGYAEIDLADPNLVLANPNSAARPGQRPSSSPRY